MSLRNRTPRHASASASARQQATTQEMTREEDIYRAREHLLSLQTPATELSHLSIESSSEEDDDELTRREMERRGGAIYPQDELQQQRRAGESEWAPAPLKVEKRRRQLSSAQRGNADGTGRSRATRLAAPLNQTALRKGGILRNWLFWTAVAVALACVLIFIIIASPGWRERRPQDGLSPPWYPTPVGGTISSWNASYAKAAKMVGQMTLVEKVNITTGTGWGMNLCVGNTGSVKRLGFPMLCLQDGPLGIRFADHATYWPAGITAAATWNKTLLYERGRGMGMEHRLKGVNVQLGPCMGPLGRMPAGGRNWEGFGPDPVLAGIASAETIMGIQDEGVIATAKHYVANEQEHFRQAGGEWGVPYAISSNIDDRTLHELYVWPFQDSVRAGVGSVMCSYNMVNDSYACDNSKLMNGILKDELGFQGFVQSDWLAQRSGVASALSGLDMTMPGDGELWADGKSFWGPNMTEAALNKSLPMERVNDMVTRIVATWYQLGQDDETVWPRGKNGSEAMPNFSSFTDNKMGQLHPDSDDMSEVVVNQFKDVQGGANHSHAILAQQIAAEGTVLLKNEANALPLDASKWSHSTYRVGIFGEDAGRAPDKIRPWPNQCDDRSCNEGTLATGWGSGAVEFPFLRTPIDALKEVFNSSNIDLKQSLTNDPTPLASLKDLDLCLVFANSDAGEGFHTWEGITDRKDLFLQKGGDALIGRVAKTCSNTIVVIHAVGPVVMEAWADNANIKAIVFANLPGEASGDALVDFLFGKVDASGRLPFTIGESLADYGSGGQIMWKPNYSLAPQQNFEEGLMIDYRHFDKNGITPRYAFGYGLSYTSWSLSDLKIQTLKAKSAMPDPRPRAAITPPSYPTDVPDRSTTFWPDNFRRLSKYIYPYLDSSTTITYSEYPYPKGYNIAQEPSAAGGEQGGNPDLWTEHVSVSVTVYNTGSQRAGQQVVQLYLSFPSNVIDPSTNSPVDFPVRVLRAFDKVDVSPSQSTTVVLRLTRRDLSYWSTGYQNWVMPTQGAFEISVGFNSRDGQALNGTW